MQECRFGHFFVPGQWRVFSSAFLALCCTSFFAAFAEDTLNINWTTLNLTQDQSQQIHSLEGEWNSTCGRLLPELKAEKAELMRLLNSPSADHNRIVQLQNRIHSKQAQLQNAAMQTYLKKKNTLNPGQQKRLHQMMSEQLSD